MFPDIPPVQLQTKRDSLAGLTFGFIGVLCFSLTLPATRIAVPELGPVIVGLGRAIIAALLAGALLTFRREPFPRRHIRGLIVTGACVVIGFPLFTALAMGVAPAVHGAVLVGFLPAATAIFAVLRGGERPSAAFWLGTALGLVAIITFAEIEGAGTLRPADLALLLAVACAGYGYAEGGRIARDIGGWRVICWALVLIAPLLVLPVGVAVAAHGLFHASPATWLGFAYVSIVSMFLGFFAWYAGLARGGIARIGQLQLLQAPLILVWGALFLGERIAPATIIAACFVVASAALSLRFR